MPVIITDYQGGVKGVSIGTTEVFFWPQTPASGQVEIAAYEAGVVTHVGIYTVGTSGRFNGSYVGVNGSVSWYLYPGSASPQIGYQISGAAGQDLADVGAVMVGPGPYETGTF